MRFSVNSSDWSLQLRHLVPSPVPTDVPTINLAFNTRPYTYVYAVYGINTNAPQSIAKVRRYRIRWSKKGGNAVAGQDTTVVAGQGKMSRWTLNVMCH